MLRKFINSNGIKEGRFYIDFSDTEGHYAGRYAYDSGVNAERIINDIKYFYQTGETRQQSSVAQFHSQYELRDSVTIAKTAEDNYNRLIEVIKNDNILRGTGRWYSSDDSEAIKRIFREGKVTRYEDRELYARAVRDAGGTYSRTFNDKEYGYELTVDEVSPEYYTGEMFQIADENQIYGVSTSFFTDYPVWDDGSLYKVAGFAAEDGNTACIKVNAKNQRDIVITKDDKYATLVGVHRLENKKAQSDVYAIVDAIDNQFKVKANSQYQFRESSLTDREVLRKAADDVKYSSKLTEPEKATLHIFKSRLTKLDQADAKRQELLDQKNALLNGRNPKDVTGDEKVEYRKIQNNLDTVNKQIKRLNEDLLHVEHQKVLHDILRKARNEIEKDSKSRWKEDLQAYKNQRNDTEVKKKYRDRIAKHAGELSQWLMKNSDKEHIPLSPSFFQCVKERGLSLLPFFNA